MKRLETPQEMERILRRQLDKIHEDKMDRALEAELDRLRALIRHEGEEPWV